MLTSFLRPRPVASDADDGFNMTNLSPSRTGIDGVTVWFSNRLGVRHDVRIKVSAKPNSPPTAIYGLRPFKLVAGDDSWMTSKQKEQVQKWAELNRDVLIQFWDSEEWDHLDAVERLQKLA